MQTERFAAAVCPLDPEDGGALRVKTVGRNQLFDQRAWLEVRIELNKGIRP